MNVGAKKSFGQHFLKDESVVRGIADAVAAGGEKLIVEVGPGHGALTDHLVRPDVSLVLVEADRDLFQELRDRFPEARLIEGDAARVEYDDAVGSDKWVFVGNLPYNASAAILAQVVSSQNLPERMIVMVQKEQGDRLRAKAGDMGLLSVVAQLSFQPSLLFHVPPGAFVPRPRVDSSVLQFRKKEVLYTAEEILGAIRVAKAGFSARRKQLHKNLAEKGFGSSDEIKVVLGKLGFLPTVRAQELHSDDWVRLWHELRQ